MTTEEGVIRVQQLLICKTDNCLLCPFSDIEPNQFGRLLEKLGFHDAARHIETHFPLVFCDHPHRKRVENGTRGRYVANPQAVPSWCPKKVE